MANRDDHSPEYETGLDDWPRWGSNARPRAEGPRAYPPPLEFPPNAVPSVNGALHPTWWRPGSVPVNPWRRGFMGRGPKNYKRSDARIAEDVNDALMMNADVDASELEVTVDKGVVRLSGLVDDRHQKRIAEELAESVLGVQDVENGLKVRHGIWSHMIGEAGGDREIARDPAREPKPGAPRTRRR